MSVEVTSNINGVVVIFNLSLQVNTVTSLKPTDFTMNYLKTLVQMAGAHFNKKMGEAMIERINEDFNSIPREKLWVLK